MNKKNKIIIIVAVAILLVIVMIIYFSGDKNKYKKIIKEFTDIGFINQDNSFLYSKQISDLNLEQYNEKVKMNVNSRYEVLYFNSSKYQLSKDLITYNNGITKNFTPTYDYSSDKIEYNYRVNFDNTNIFIEGSYDNINKTFICNTKFAFNIDIDETKEDICNKLKLDVENYSYQATSFIKNKDLLNYIRNKKD